MNGLAAGTGGAFSNEESDSGNIGFGISNPLIQEKIVQYIYMNANNSGAWTGVKKAL